MAEEKSFLIVGFKTSLYIRYVLTDFYLVREKLGKNRIALCWKGRKTEWSTNNIIGDYISTKCWLFFGRSLG